MQNIHEIKIYLELYDFLKLMWNQKQNGRLNSLLYIRLTTAAGVEVDQKNGKNYNKLENDKTPTSSSTRRVVILI